MQYRIVFPTLLATLSLFACNNSDSPANLATDTTTLSSTPTTGMTPALTAEMAQVSRAYVPALFYTNNTAAPLPIAAAGKAALSRLDSRWQAFVVNSAATFPPATTAKPAVDTHLLAANNTLDQVSTYPADLSAAHEHLEDIRTVMLQMRRDNGIDDVMDTLTLAHRSMGDVVAAFTGATTPALLTQQHKADLTVQLANYTSAFNTLAARKIDSELFGFSPAKTQGIQAAVSASKQNNTALQDALLLNDNAAILAAANKVKPLFVKLFLAYGDFLSPSAPQWVAFDQAYIPALFASNNTVATFENVQAAQTALTALETRWNVLGSATTSSRYPVTLQTPLNWTTYFSAINANIAASKTALEAALAAGDFPTDITPAHEPLEDIRMQLLALRTLENYEWVMDPITRYHHGFEPALTAVKNVVDGSQLTAEITAIIVQTLPVLQAEMPKMVTAVQQLDPTLYAFSAEKQAALNTSLTAQTQNLAALAAALTANDATAIVARTKQVKALFVPFFLQFGG